MNVLRWDSVGEYLADALPIVDSDRPIACYRDGGERRRAACTAARLAIEGDPALAANVASMDLAIEAAHAEEDRAHWDLHVLGSSLSPGRYAMGLPMCMRRRVQAPTDYRRVTIIVNTGLSSGVNEWQAARRAACIMGLVSRLMAEGVSLDLFFYEDGEAPPEGLAPHAKGQPWQKRLTKSDTSRDYCQLIRIDTTPINIAQAAFLLTSPKIFRDLMLPAAIGGFASATATQWPFNSDDRQRWAETVRRELDLAPTDLYIASYHLDDAHMDPKAWIAKYASQALGT